MPVLRKPRAVITPGRKLVVAQSCPKARQGAESVIASFLSFLAKELTRSSQHISPLNRGLVRRISRLSGNIETDLTENLGDQDLGVMEANGSPDCRLRP